MPALNARPALQLDEWLAEITEALAAHDRAHPDRPAAPLAINQVVQKATSDSSTTWRCVPNTRCPSSSPA